MTLALRRLPTPNARIFNELLIFGGLSAAFLALLLTAPHTHPSPFDRVLMRDVQGIPWGSFSFIPRLGSDIGGGLYGAYLVPALLGVAFAGTRQWRLLGLLAAVFALHYILISPKMFITAYRPSPLFGVEGAGGLESFPSGHVQWAVSFWGFAMVLGWRSLSGSRLRWAVLAAYVLVVLGTMLGRMELGRHWPLDTVAGVIAGLVALRLLVLMLPSRRPESPALLVQQPPLASHG
jgi:undecaprenyl-diphosphatase